MSKEVKITIYEAQLKQICNPCIAVIVEDKEIGRTQVIQSTNKPSWKTENEFTTVIYPDKGIHLEVYSDNTILGRCGPYIIYDFETNVYICPMNEDDEQKITVKLEITEIEEVFSEDEDNIGNEATWENLIKYTEKFNNFFPTKKNRIIYIEKKKPFLKNKIVQFARNTRIIVHQKVYNFAEKFLCLKMEIGSEVEKQVYKDMTTDQFFQRLIKKRPLVFYTSFDHTFDRRKNSPDGEHWRFVGTEKEKTISLEKYLSYDEMQISSLIGVSSPTIFINSGSRYNEARNGKPGTFEPEGIYIGIVGARFEHSDLMESQHILSVDKSPHPGTGRNADPNLPETKKSRLWAEFYGETYDGISYFPTYKEIDEMIKNDKIDEEKYYKMRGGYFTPSRYFNIFVFKKRILLSVEIFLLDANKRGEETSKKVYVHTVGIGLGVWQICQDQGKWTIDVYYEAIRRNELPYISDLDFSWFPVNITKCGHTNNGDIMKTKNGNKIKIKFSKRDPADKLTGEDEEKLLVACYAWDGNSFPGNEYWRGGLSASGDPAAACCSLIPELQNAYINKWFIKNIYKFGRDDELIISSSSSSESSEETSEDSSSGEVMSSIYVKLIKNKDSEEKSEEVSEVEKKELNDTQDEASKEMDEEMTNDIIGKVEDKIVTGDKKDVNDTGVEEDVKAKENNVSGDDEDLVSKVENKNDTSDKKDVNDSVDEKDVMEIENVKEQNTISDTTDKHVPHV